MDVRVRAQVSYAAADAACLLAVLDSLVAAAPPRQHVLDGTTTPQRAVATVSRPAADAVSTVEPAAAEEAPGTEQSRRASSPAAAGGDDAVRGPSGDGGEASSRTAAAEVVRWWAERIQLSGRGTLVCEAPEAVFTLACRNTCVHVLRPSSECLPVVDAGSARAVL